MLLLPVWVGKYIRNNFGYPFCANLDLYYDYISSICLIIVCLSILLFEIIH
jgi:predicted Na+-dependent transporter